MLTMSVKNHTLTHRAKFGVVSSSHFPFRVQTHKQTHTVTDVADHPSYTSATAGVGNHVKITRGETEIK